MSLNIPKAIWDSNQKSTFSKSYFLEKTVVKFNIFIEFFRYLIFQTIELWLTYSKISCQ